MEAAGPAPMPIPPTDTPVPPTDTPVPPTNTPVPPPTDTPVPPTATPTPRPPVPPSLSKPPAPTGLGVTSTSRTSIGLDWNSRSGISKYRISYESTTKETASSAYTVTGLTCGKRCGPRGMAPATLINAPDHGSAPSAGPPCREPQRRV